jgi:N-dimethylarginine dimethylaminohydrolase
VNIKALERYMQRNDAKQNSDIPAENTDIREKALTKKTLMSGDVSAKEADTPSDLKVPTYLMNFPFTLEVGDANNVWMKKLPPAKRKLDYEKAFTQFLSLYNFLASNSCVYLLPSSYEKQDLPYVANLGAYLPHIKDKETIVLAKMKSPPRQGEEPIGNAFFKMMKYRVIPSPWYFEGEAELKWLNDNNYCMGYGQRTDKQMATFFTKNLAMNVIPIEETDPYCYHLDCSIFPLTKEKAIVCTKLLKPQEIKQIEKYTEIIPVDKEMARDGVTNCVRCRNMILCASSINEHKENTDDYKKARKKIEFLNQTCADEGLEAIIINLSEFEKSGAALSCLCMNLSFCDMKKATSQQENTNGNRY